jgi:hypothetical protein
LARVPSMTPPMTRSLPRSPTGRRSPARLARFAAAALLAASVQGGPRSVGLASEPLEIREVEPDGTAACAVDGGLLAPGSRVRILGHVEARAPDALDGFRFAASAPCTLRFRLTPSLPGADLDLHVYDPALDAFTACFDSRSAPETGEIALAVRGEEVHLVVSSAWGSSSYALEIEVVPLAARSTGAPAASVRAPARLSSYLRGSSATRAGLQEFVSGPARTPR